ncbi:hypothetical protein [Bradyrhizobium sp. STM 3566]|uniref:hypothetical protein n=1 Tax=Bradyrhizobium sp. STM 3566 TaxID=578928 RepID=UPI003890B6F3
MQNATCGNDSPAVWARESGTSGNISFVDNDLSGTTVPMPMALANTWSGNLPTSYTFSNNLGLLMDERTSGRPVVKSGFPYQDLQNINLSASSTGSTGGWCTDNHAVAGVRNHRHQRLYRIRVRYAAARLDRHRRGCLDLCAERPEHQRCDPLCHRPALLSCVTFPNHALGGMTPEQFEDTVTGSSTEWRTDQ